MNRGAKFAGIIRSEVCRVLLSPRLYFSVLAVALIFGLNLVVNTARIEEESVMYHIDLILYVGPVKYLMMLVASFPFSTLFLEDWRGRFAFLEISRAGIKEYVCSKTIVCFVGTWMVTFTGAHLFWLAASFKMPLLKANDVFGDGYRYPYDILVSSGSGYLFMLIAVSIISAAIAFWAVFGLLISVVFKNVFMTAGLPVLAVYYIENSYLTVWLGRLPGFLDINHLSRYGDVGLGIWGDFTYTMLFFVFLSAVVGFVFYKGLKGLVSGESV